MAFFVKTSFELFERQFALPAKKAFLVPVYVARRVFGGGEYVLVVDEASTAGTFVTVVTASVASFELTIFDVRYVEIVGEYVVVVAELIR